MTKKSYGIKEDIAEKLDLPRDVLLDIPKITITGDNEITIENHKGIIMFDNEIIKVNSKIGSISIWGKGFEIVFMGGKTLTLKGRFNSVVYEGNV